MTCRALCLAGLLLFSLPGILSTYELLAYKVRSRNVFNRGLEARQSNFMGRDTQLPSSELYATNEKG
jgi:hypothetical protein